MGASARVEASTPEARLRMQRVRQKNTSAEAALRRELHARGLRYRIHVPVLTKSRRVADIAFRGLRVAVFVDGCFWHGCPVHGTWPKQNAEFWRAKIEANMARDKNTDERLRAEGWKVIRVWAHEEPNVAAGRVAHIIERRREKHST
jgi:DNA mismatch endonuclease, patch repair protein